MAFSTTELDELQAAYAAGVTQIRHGDKTVVYGSLEDLWKAIQRIELSLTPRASKYTHGVIRFRTRFGD